MAVDFKIIVITQPQTEPISDARAIVEMLDTCAVDYIHIRKPEHTLTQVKQLIEAIPPKYHGRLRLHGHFALLDQFNLAGAQLNSRCPEAPRTARTLTLTCHSAEEIPSDGFEYVTLSPIYSSISKPGYRSAITDSDYRPSEAKVPVLALGGVDPSKFRELKERGFAGAAMLGWIWSGDLQRKLRLVKMMSRFTPQFITNSPTAAGTAAQVERVLAMGCRWVQIRMKDADDAEVLRAIELVKPMTDACDAILLVDDRVEIARQTGIDGVHVGRGDMHPTEARKILGPRVIIGATANTVDDIKKAGSEADYFGIGPFRYTTTKKNLAPVLGIAGYEDILGKLPAEHAPIVAIGGITRDDIAAIMATGVDGIAASGMFSAEND